jgi:hypothetical protein
MFIIVVYISVSDLCEASFPNAVLNSAHYEVDSLLGMIFGQLTRKSENWNILIPYV